jgi:catechol 2,3-dioxygenase-like lactoylglutathione lyase family enzyme
MSLGGVIRQGRKMTAENSMSFTGCRPVFPVTNLDASLAYYVNVLGFNVGWLLPKPEESGSDGMKSGTAYIYGGDFELLIRSQAPPVNPVEIVVGMPSTMAVDAIGQEYFASGAEILEPPFHRDWGTYEMLVVDPDGHLLRILH